MSVSKLEQAAFVAGWRACQDYAPQDMPSDEDIARIAASWWKTTHAAKEAEYQAWLAANRAAGVDV